MTKAKDVRILIPTPLRTLTENKKIVYVRGESIDSALKNLMIKHPKLNNHLYDEKGSLRNFVNVYLNNEDIRYLDKNNVLLQDGDSITIVPSIAGG